MSGDATLHPLSRHPHPALRPLAWALSILTFTAVALAQAPDHPAPAPQATPAPTTAPTQAPTPAQPASIPAARAATNVAVITIHGGIDEWTARSVVRRIKAAEDNKAEAIVFDLDTPGGEMQAMLVIAGAIKRAGVRNTVAWVNPNAYSAGCIIALACREIVIADTAALGDALPIEVNILTGFKPIPDAEREKFLGPVMADLIDSARRGGVDEVLVQGFVRRGVELWLVEHQSTGERLFVTEEQFRLAVGAAPPHDLPTLKSITGPVDPRAKRQRPPARRTPAPNDPPEPTDMVPASPTMGPVLLGQVNQELSLRGTPSTRPDLRAPEHAGRYRLVEYVCDGSGVLTLREPELLRYGLAAAKVNSDEELKAFFGAQNLARLDESWSEAAARLLSHPIAKGLLIVVFLIALFIEMTHPGLILPGCIAAGALVGLILPPLVVNMAAWWMAAAIVAGVACIGLELFITPGLGAFGVVGVVLLFGGLVGAVIGGPQGLFPTTARARGDLLIGLTTTLLSLIVAGGVIWAIARSMPRLPFFGRLVLTEGDADDADPLFEPAAAPLRPGQRGVAITPLRPAGRVQFGDQIVDVVADTGFIDPGTPVRVVHADGFRTTVEADRAHPQPDEPPPHDPFAPKPPPTPPAPQ
jgi:membrane-bound ClpP family serine protease